MSELKKEIEFLDRTKLLKLKYSPLKKRASHFKVIGDSFFAHSEDPNLQLTT